MRQSPIVADTGLRPLADLLVGAPGLLSVEECDQLMQTGAHHTLCVTYWAGSHGLRAWWERTDVQAVLDATIGTNVGLFVEEFTSPRDHLEANSSRPDAEWGIGGHHEWREDRRIGYWGASRDRIDAAEDDGVPAESGVFPGARAFSGAGRRVDIVPPGNVCFIRTVQGWSGADDEQREFFLRGPYRAYLDGVRDLQENPDRTTCLSARLLAQPEVSPRRPVRETQAWFLSLSDMEQWVWHSPTHGRIMQTFTEFADRFGLDINLLLSHEVYVVPPGSARCTYVNCSTPTGLLRYAEDPAFRPTARRTGG